MARFLACSLIALPRTLAAVEREGYFPSQMCKLMPSGATNTAHLQAFSSARGDPMPSLDRAANPGAVGQQGALDVEAYASAFAEPSASNGGCEHEDSGCCKCIKEASHYLMEVHIKHAKEHCKDAKCPFAQKVCEWFKEHPKVGEGYLCQEKRVVSTAYAYCIGKGSCPMPDEKRESEAKLHQRLAEWTMMTLSNAPHAMENQAEQSLLQKGKESSNAEVLEERKHEAFHVPKGVMQCTERKSCAIMRQVLGHFRHHCAETNCEHMQRICKWAEHHQEEFLGVMMAIVHPWDFSAGYCWPHDHEDKALSSSRSAAAPEALTV